MIKFALKCADGHSFDSWFQNGEAYTRLSAAGHVACAICGNAKVEKAIMAPRVGPKTNSEVARPLSAPASPAEQAMRELRKHIEDNSENVGRNFTKEVRDMHYGDSPQRSVHGEAKLEDAKSLIEEGIPVAPLPWGRDKAN